MIRLPLDLRVERGFLFELEQFSTVKGLLALTFTFLYYSYAYDIVAIYLSQAR